MKKIYEPQNREFENLNSAKVSSIEELYDKVKHNSSRAELCLTMPNPVDAYNSACTENTLSELRFSLSEKEINEEQYLELLKFAFFDKIRLGLYLIKSGNEFQLSLLHQLSAAHCKFLFCIMGKFPKHIDYVIVRMCAESHVNMYRLLHLIGLNITNRTQLAEFLNPLLTEEELFKKIEEYEK